MPLLVGAATSSIEGACESDGAIWSYRRTSFPEELAIPSLPRVEGLIAGLYER